MEKGERRGKKNRDNGRFLARSFVNGMALPLDAKRLKRCSFLEALLLLLNLEMKNGDDWKSVSLLLNLCARHL